MIDQVSLLNYFGLKLSDREKPIYDVLATNPNITSKDIMNILGVYDPNIVRPRLSDMQKKGIVEKSGIISINKKQQNLWKLSGSVCCVF